MTSNTFLAAFALAFLTLSTARPSRAEPSGADVALAETLFGEGKRLMAEHEYARACEKLAESQRLDPGGGTLLALGLCHEAEGKIATAWAEFNDAEALAIRDKNADREGIAREHIQALEPRLSRLTINVPSELGRTVGLRILRNGAPLPPAAWGVAVPVDPGDQHIEVDAPGKQAWSKTLRMDGDAQKMTADLVPLSDLPAKAAPETRAPPPRPVRSNGWKPVGYIAIGAGSALVVAGGLLGWRAISENSDAKQRCPRSPCDDPEGVRLNSRAQADADLSTVAVVAGAVSVGAGAAILVFGPGRDEAGPRVAIGIGHVELSSRW